MNDLSEKIEEMLSHLDVDFGYAVGNLNMDTTPESRKEIIQALVALLQDAQREARIDEARMVVDVIDQLPNNEMAAHISAHQLVRIKTLQHSQNKEDVDGCPCFLVEPCDPQCTCAKPHMSGGCMRCAKYGSGGQRIAAAKRLASLRQDRREK